MPRHCRSGVEPSPPSPTCGIEITGYALTFLLGIYGGLFSGGYVTILAAVFVATFRMTFIEAIATTKLINIVSSGIATVISCGEVWWITVSEPFRVRRCFSTLYSVRATHAA